jgi:CBS domain-containing protein
MELSRNLKIDSVSRLGPTPPREVEADRAVAGAVAVMREHRVGCLLVTAGGKLVGIFTERDLLTRVLAAGLPLSTPLRECMTPNPVTVGPKDSVRVAIQKMQDGAYRHLPVVDETNRPVGVLSAKRVVRYLVEHFPALIYTQPPDPTNSPAEPEGP